MEKKIIGMKYQTYIDDDLVVFRLVGIKNWDSFIMRNDKDPDTKVIMTSKQLNNCVALQPDAVMHIVSTSRKEDAQVPDDVYAYVTTFDDMVQSANEDNSIPSPSLILRQDIYSLTKNVFLLSPDDNKIILGDCQSVKTISKDELEKMMDFKKIINKCTIVLYVDDTLQDVLMCVGKRLKLFNSALEAVKNHYKDNSNIAGVSSTFEGLLKDNMFMENFRLLFGVTTIEIAIELDNAEYTDGIITLNNTQKKYIEDLLKQYIDDIKVLRYDKDIDISKIVQTSHIMVCDRNEKIYLISYVVNRAYPIDEEAKSAMLNLIK